MVNRNELWKGQEAQVIRSQFFRPSNEGKTIQTFSGRDRKTVDELKSSQHQYQEKHLGVEERMARATKNIQDRVEDVMRQSEVEQIIDSSYLERIMAFDEALHEMPEQVQSQVQKLAKAITREFNLDGKEKIAVTDSTTVVNPENLIANIAKDLLKSATPEIVFAAPLALALIVVSRMSPDQKAKIASFYDKFPVRFRRSFVLLLSTALLAACATAAPTPTPEVPSGGTTPQAGETTNVPAENATEASESPTEVTDQTIGLKVKPSVEESINNDPILQKLDPVEKQHIIDACVEFAKKLDERGDIDVNSTKNVFSVEDGICQVTTSTGDIIRNIWNTEGPLYLTAAGASAALGVEVAEVRADGRHGTLGDAYDADGNWVGGVNAQAKWEAVDENGRLPSQINPATQVPTPVNEPDPKAYVNPTPISPEAMQQATMAKVKDYQNGALKDFSGFNLQQMEAFGKIYDEELKKDYKEADFEQQKAFSLALNEKRNEQSGPNIVTRIDESGKKVYLGEDGMWHTEPQTIEKYTAKIIDGGGYTHIFHEGAWIKIENSQNIKFEEDIVNGDFKWPDTEIVDPQWVTEKNKHLLGLGIPEYSFKMESKTQKSIVPIIVLSKNLGEFNVAGFGSTGSLGVYPINESDSYSIKKYTLIGNIGLFGNNLAARSSGELSMSSPFWQELEEYKIYELMYEDDQVKDISESYPQSNGVELTDGYEGLTPSELTHVNITGQSNDGGMSVIKGMMLIEVDN